MSQDWSFAWIRTVSPAVRRRGATVQTVFMNLKRRRGFRGHSTADRTPYCRQGVGPVARYRRRKR